VKYERYKQVCVTGLLVSLVFHTGPARSAASEWRAQPSHPQPSVGRPAVVFPRPPRPFCALSDVFRDSGRPRAPAQRRSSSRRLRALRDPSAVSAMSFVTVVLSASSAVLSGLSDVFRDSGRPHATSPASVVQPSSFPRLPRPFCALSDVFRDSGRPHAPSPASVVQPSSPRPLRSFCGLSDVFRDCCSVRVGCGSQRSQRCLS
jgi:hypothetical protein